MEEKEIIDNKEEIVEEKNEEVKTLSKDEVVEKLTADLEEQKIKSMTVDTFGVDYPEPEKI